MRGKAQKKKGRIETVKNKTSKKWNRKHFFKRKKSNKKGVGHPVYVYGQSGRTYKYLTFTRHPKNDVDYEALEYNIDPSKENSDEKSYVKKKFDTARDDAFEDPSIKYRIHNKDVARIKKYKK